MKFSLGAKRNEWHSYFAWYPVFCNDISKFVWMEKVERKIQLGYTDDSFEYRMNTNDK